MAQRYPPSIQVPSKLSASTHPAVRRLAEVHKGHAKDSRTGTHNADPRWKIANTMVTAATSHRALMILDAVWRGCESAGWVVRPAAPQGVTTAPRSGPEFVVAIRGVEVTVRVIEEGNIDKENRRSDPRNILVPNGRLRIEIDGLWPYQRRWSDGPKHLVEHMLGAVLESIRMGADVRAAEMAERKRLAEINALKSAAELQRSKERTELLNAVDRWSRAEEIRRFGRELASAGGEARWVDFANEIADELDPLLGPTIDLA